MNYYEITFHDIDETSQELLIAKLAAAGYEGFEQTDDTLKAFIPESQYEEASLTNLAPQKDFKYETRIVEEQNWNSEWESSFSPVVIENFAGIRAEFHQPLKDVKYEIIITPKMSFGTGHHATTFMMIREMSGLDFKDQEVLDFGTGTGVLAILAKKMGAEKVAAIDYDDWSIENARENITMNHCTGIDLIKQDNADVPGTYGIILANINRNIILDNLPVFARKLIRNGNLLVSGLLISDRDEVIKMAGAVGLKLVSEDRQNNWILLRFTH